MIKIWKWIHLNIDYPLNYALAQFLLAVVFTKQITAVFNNLFFLFKKAQFVTYLSFIFSKRGPSFCPM